MSQPLTNQPSDSARAFVDRLSFQDPHFTSTGKSCGPVCPGAEQGNCFADLRGADEGDAQGLIAQSSASKLDDILKYLEDVEAQVRPLPARNTGQ